MALVVSLTFVALAHFAPVAAFAAYVGFNALFNLPHQYATWRRVTHEVPARLTLFALAPMAALIALLHANETARALLLENALPYWGIWHLASQHYGVSSMLRRRTGEAPDRRDRDFFLSLFVLGLLHAHASRSLSLHLGDHVVTMMRLPLPPGSGPLISITCVALFAVLSAAQLVPAWRWNPARAKQQALIALATFAAFFLCNDLMMTIASITAFHNLQYVGVVSDHQTRAGRPLTPRDVVFAALYSLAVNLAFVASVSFGEVLLASLIALHYGVDGRIWRRPKQERGTLGACAPLPYSPVSSRST